MADDNNPDSAANVAMRAFAQTMSPPSAAPNSTPTQTRQPGRSSASRAAATPASKRGRGRRSKTKKSTVKAASKSASVSMQKAPTAEMTADTSGTLPDADAVTMSQQQDGQPPAFGSAASPAPALVLRPEEAEANRSTLSTLDQYRAAAETYQAVLQARTDNKPMAGSLTGLPPSSKEVENAKRRLKDVTQAMMLNLD